MLNKSTPPPLLSLPCKLFFCRRSPTRATGSTGATPLKECLQAYTPRTAPRKPPCTTCTLRCWRRRQLRLSWWRCSRASKAVVDREGVGGGKRWPLSGRLSRYDITVLLYSSIYRIGSMIDSTHRAPIRVLKYCCISDRRNG